MLDASDLTLAWDATTLCGVHVNQIHIMSTDGQMAVTTDALPGGTGDDYAEHIVGSILHCAAVSSRYTGEDYTSLLSRIVSKLRCTMTDRAAVNHCATVRLQNQLQINLLELNCQLHPLECVASTARDALLSHEESFGHSERSKTFGRTAGAVNVISALSKLRYKDGKGDPAGFKAFLRAEKIDGRLLIRYVGNRLHAVFHLAASVFFLREKLMTYLKRCSQRSLSLAIIGDLSKDLIVTHLQVLGLFGKLITGPWMTVMYTDQTARGHMEMMIVFIDPLAVPEEKDKSLVSKSLTEAGFTCDFVSQRVEKTVSWCAGKEVQPDVRKDIDSECLVLLTSEEAVKMVKAYHDRKQGELADQLTLTEYVESLQVAMPWKNFTVFIVGLNKYYSNQKLSKKQAHREAVTGKPGRGKKKAGQNDVTITCEEAEEVFVELQLLTGCVIQHVDSYGEMAEEIKRFTKAVMDKPKKKNRLDSAFSFTNTNGPGLSVSKTGEGLIKVWKQQLTQFNNFGPDMAEAVITNYPSPLALKEVCESCHTASDTERMIGDINVRRGIGVVATNRRIGKEHARRIYTFMSSTDPDQILK